MTQKKLRADVWSTRCVLIFTTLINGFNIISIYSTEQVVIKQMILFCVISILYNITRIIIITAFSIDIKIRA